MVRVSVQCGEKMLVDFSDLTAMFSKLGTGKRVRITRKIYYLDYGTSQQRDHKIEQKHK